MVIIRVLLIKQIIPWNITALGSMHSKHLNLNISGLVVQNGNLNQTRIQTAKHSERIGQLISSWRKPCALPRSSCIANQGIALRFKRVPTASRLNIGKDKIPLGTTL